MRARRKSPPRKKDPGSRRAAPSWLRFSIQLKEGQKLEQARECIEISLGTKLRDYFPEILEYRTGVWDHDPRRKDGRRDAHRVDAPTLARRKGALAAGKPAGLPIRLEDAFPGIEKAAPKIGPEIMKQRFAVLTLPVDRRTFNRKSCKPNGMLYDFAYKLRKSCGFPGVTPALVHPIGLQAALAGGALAILFPRRPPPSQVAVPSVATWHLFNIGATNIGGASTLPAGSNGAGVVVGHADTGWTPHPQLNFTAGTSPNYVAGFEANAYPPGGPSALEAIPAPSVPFDNPFHGTRTASMIISANDGVVAGVAPSATMFPVRCTADVVLFPPLVDDIVVASAIVTAVGRGAQVISISLGGYTSRILRWAVQYAVLSNVIVVAAAGNFWPLVVYPAGYPECIAVGGSTADDVNWAYSARNYLGPQIDISAPSEFITNATWSGSTSTTQSNDGTSFGTALVAGAAALWLQAFGRATLIGALAGVPLQSLFKEHLRVTARVPPGWNSLLDGPGILNLTGLLNPATLPLIGGFLPPPWVLNLLAGLYDGANLLMKDLFGVDLYGARPAWVSAMLGGNADEIVSEYAEEVLQLLLSNPLAADMINAVDEAVKTAEEAAANAENAAEEIADSAQAAAEQAQETAEEVVENAVDTVSNGASDAVNTAAGWF